MIVTECFISKMHVLVHLSGGEEQEMYRGHHGHLLAGDCLCPDFLAEHEEGTGEGGRLSGAIDRRLVNERRLGLGGQDPALVLVHADIRVEAHGEERDHHVKAVVRAVTVKSPGTTTTIIPHLSIIFLPKPTLA